MDTFFKSFEGISLEDVTSQANVWAASQELEGFEIVKWQVSTWQLTMQPGHTRFGLAIEFFPGVRDETADDDDESKYDDTPDNTEMSDESQKLPQEAFEDGESG